MPAASTEFASARLIGEIPSDLQGLFAVPFSAPLGLRSSKDNRNHQAVLYPPYPTAAGELPEAVANLLPAITRMIGLADAAGAWQAANNTKIEVAIRQEPTVLRSRGVKWYTTAGHLGQVVASSGVGRLYKLPSDESHQAPPFGVLFLPADTPYTDAPFGVPPSVSRTRIQLTLREVPRREKTTGFSVWG